MLKTAGAALIAAALLSAGWSAASAKSMSGSVLLKPVNMHNMKIAHASGNASIKYTAHDANIRLTAERLPKPTALHQKVYVVWAITGKQKMNIGHFSVRNGMGGAHLMPMVTKFNKLVVSAERSVTVPHPMGVLVLSGAVMHH
jgi:hypothetical protein